MCYNEYINNNKVENKMAKLKVLNQRQQLLINDGGLHRKQLQKAVTRALSKTSKRDFYIFSPPGLGKTYTVEKQFAQQNIECVPIKGNASLWGFIVDMATVVSLRDPKEHLFLFIDDCDNLLLHGDSVNTLKIAFDENKLNYNKQMMAQYAQLTEEEQGYIDNFRNEGRNGISIPLDNMTIVWCSNYKLATKQDVNKAEKGSNKWFKFTHEEALRRRLNARDYDVDMDTAWGWIADCVLNSTPPSMKTATLAQKEEILDFMYKYINRVTELNITFAEKLYEEMELDPITYSTSWEYDYLIHE